MLFTRNLDPETNESLTELFSFFFRYAFKDFRG